MKTITLILSLILFSASADAQHKAPTSRKNADKRNIWSNRSECFDNLDHYFPEDGFVHIKLTFYMRTSDSTYFHLTCFDGTAYLKKMNVPIDIQSIEDLGEFLVDKNNVYRYYDTSDGRLIFELEEADRNSFKTFGNSIYAKDKYHVFDSRHGIIEMADVETFKAIRIESNGRRAYGMDKNNYYFWNQIVTDTVGFGAILKKK